MSFKNHFLVIIISLFISSSVFGGVTQTTQKLPYPIINPMADENVGKVRVTLSSDFEAQDEQPEKLMVFQQESWKCSNEKDIGRFFSGFGLTGEFTITCTDDNGFFRNMVNCRYTSTDFGGQINTSNNTFTMYFRPGHGKVIHLPEIDNTNMLQELLCFELKHMGVDVDELKDITLKGNKVAFAYSSPNGYPIHGGGRVWVWGDSKNQEHSFIIRSIAYQRRSWRPFSKYPVKSLKEIIRDLENGQGSFFRPFRNYDYVLEHMPVDGKIHTNQRKGKPNSLTVTNITLVYYENKPEFKQEFLQPVYRIDTAHGWEVYIPALQWEVLKPPIEKVYPESGSISIYSQ